MSPTIEAAAGHPTRCRTYQAPDPAWAPAELLERVRQRLWALDPRLNIWWNPHWKIEDKERPGRWAIMFWLNRTAVWSVVEYWEGAGGEFRPIQPECIDEIIARLRASEEEADVAMRRIDMANALRVESEERELAQALNERFEDMRDRTFGVKQTFGRGSGPRKRRALDRLINEEANETQAFVREIKAEQARKREARAAEVRRRGRHG